MEKSKKKYNSQLKINRMLALYERLSRGEQINKAREALYYGVNEKTIQRDIKDLRNYLHEFYMEESNTDIVYNRSQKAYTLFREQNIWLTNPEILAITKILLESRAFPSEEMNLLLDKLVSQNSENERLHIKEILINERYHYKPLEHSQPLIHKIWDLSRAVREKRLLEVKYIRAGDQKEVTRTLHPQGILFSEYYFYLMAYIQGTDYDTPTIYRLDKITNYSISNEHFYQPYCQRFEEGELRKKIQFMQSGELITIQFCFWGESQEAVLDRLPNARIIGQNDKGPIFEAQVLSRGINMWLLSQGATLEVIKPQSLREEMQQIILSMGRCYSG